MFEKLFYTGISVLVIAGTILNLSLIASGAGLTLSMIGVASLICLLALIPIAAMDHKAAEQQKKLSEALDQYNNK